MCQARSEVAHHCRDWRPESSTTPVPEWKEAALVVTTLGGTAISLRTV